jgi:molybdopterin-guanine dinucleotide biosynthesis protein A
MPTGKITGIVLAGGQSRRMGQDKGLMLLKNQPLTSWSVRILQSFTENILISSNNLSYERFGYPVIKDIVPDIGPIGGILSCLEHSSSDINIFISCDSPFIKPGLYDYLIQSIGSNLAAVPWFGDQRYEPLCAVYRKSILSPLKSFIESGNFKLPQFFETVEINKITMTGTEPFHHPYLFFNVNTPKKLARAQELVEKHMIPF